MTTHTANSQVTGHHVQVAGARLYYQPHGPAHPRPRRRRPPYQAA
jgi:hypothetical protein